MSSGSPAPAPVIAEFPLPIGIESLEQWMELTGHAVVISIIVASVLAIFVWDFFVLLSDEISVYRQSDFWRTPAFYAFLILRYSGFLAFLPALFFTAAQSRHCQVAASLSQTGCVLVVGSAGIIFCYRVFALWQDNRVVRIVVIFFYLLMVGCWLATATQLQALTGPPSPLLSNCIMVPIPSWSPIGYASCVAFDTIVLGLTIAKLRTNLGGQHRVTKQLYQDNAIYFILVTATNIVVLAVQSLGPSYDLLKPKVLPFSTLMTYAMGCRVFLNLRRLRDPQQRQQDSIPLSNSHTSSFNSRGPGSHQPKSIVVNYSQHVVQDSSLNDKAAPFQSSFA